MLMTAKAAAAAVDASSTPTATSVSMGGSVPLNASLLPSGAPLAAMDCLRTPPGSPRGFSPYPVAEEIPPMELGDHVDFVHTFDASRTVYDDEDPRAYNPEEHYSEYAYGDVSGVSLHSHACVSLARLPCAFLILFLSFFLSPAGCFPDGAGCVDSLHGVFPD
jgi:hypothetical protein